MKKQRNMHRVDPIFRCLMDFVLIYLGLGTDVLTSDILSKVLLVAVGVFTLISGITGHCSIYHIAGFNTYKNNPKSL